MTREITADACPMTGICEQLGTAMSACGTARFPNWESREMAEQDKLSEDSFRLELVQRDVERMMACMASIVCLLAKQQGLTKS